MAAYCKQMGWRENYKKKEIQTTFNLTHIRSIPCPYPGRTKPNAIDTEQVRFWYGSEHDKKEK